MLLHLHARRRFPRILTRALMAGMLGCAVAACGAEASGGGSAADGEAAADSGAQTRIIEHAGGSTEVPVEPDRVATNDVVIAGHLTSVGVLPVAGPDEVDEWLTPYADAGLIHGLNPAEIEQVGGEETDFERLAGLAPDLILIDEYAIDQFETFSEIAPTVVVSRPTNADWQDAFDQTVAATGAEDSAEQRRARYADLLGDVPASAGDTEVTFLRGSGPGQFRLDALGGFAGSVAEEAGYAVDIGDATPEQAREGNLEYSNEQLGVVSGNLLVTTTQAEGGPSSIAELQATPLWRSIPPVQNGRIVELPHSVYNGGTYVAAELLLRALIDGAGDGQATP